MWKPPEAYRVEITSSFPVLVPASWRERARASSWTVMIAFDCPILVLVIIE